VIGIHVDTKATRQAAASIARDLLLGAPVVLDDVTQEVAEHARAHPEFYKPRHGMAGLQGATRAKLEIASGPTIRARVWNAKPYGIAVHDGSRPHEIRARRAPYLVFFWEKVGHWVRFKKVNHPGTAPRPFLQTPRRYGEQRLIIRLYDLVGNTIKRYSK
jgi:hypothetical protein